MWKLFTVLVIFVAVIYERAHGKTSFISKLAYFHIISELCIQQLNLSLHRKVIIKQFIHFRNIVNLPSLQTSYVGMFVCSSHVSH